MSLTQFGNALSLHAYLRKELIKAQRLRAVLSQRPLIRTDLFDLASLLTGNSHIISNLVSAMGALYSFADAFREFILTEERYKILADEEFIFGNKIARDAEFVDRYISRIPVDLSTSSNLIRLVDATIPEIREPTLEDITLAFTAPLTFRTLAQDLYKVSPANILGNDELGSDPDVMRYNLGRDVTESGNYMTFGSDAAYLVFERAANSPATAVLSYTFSALLFGMYLRNPSVNIVNVLDGVTVRNALIPARLNAEVYMAGGDDRHIKLGRCNAGIIRVGASIRIVFADELPAGIARYVFKISGDFLLSGCEIAQAAKQMCSVPKIACTWNAALDGGIIPYFQSQPNGAGMNGCAGNMTSSLNRAYEKIYIRVANNARPGMATAYPLNNYYYEHSRLVATLFGDNEWNENFPYTVRQKVCQHMVVVSCLLTSLYQYHVLPVGS